MSAEKKIQNEPASKQSLRVWLKLLKASSTIESALRRKLRGQHRSTMPRFDVMSALDRHPNGLKMSEVSDLLRVSNGNVTTIVDRLVEDGLVQRRQIPGDRRAIEISLTAEGRTTFASQAAAHEVWVAEMLVGLGRNSLDDLNHMLEDLNAHLEILEGRK
jgi:DNA-binding MarR family transcriptional regulator